VRTAVNAALFAALIVMLMFAVALSFPALRTALNVEPLLGKLPATPAVMTTGVRVAEVMTSNKSTLPDETGAFTDWIELTNIGTSAIPLQGYALSDRDNRTKFVFPDVTIAPGEYMLVFASGVESVDPDKPLHASMRLSSTGETLYLIDDNGGVVESITVPAMTADESYARSGIRWSKTSSPTPGFENTPAGREAFLSSITVNYSGLQLNELMASNASTLADEDGDASDWIELFNSSPLTIDLSHCALSDNPAQPVKWRFPEGAVIQPYSTYLLFASGKSRPSAVNPHTSFKLRADHGVVILSDLAGNVIDSAEYDNLGADAVWARRRNNDPWEMTTTPTPGTTNP
jgi:hypothetical protein